MRLFVVIGLRRYEDLARFYVNSLKMWVVKNTIESCTFVRIFVIVYFLPFIHGIPYPPCIPDNVVTRRVETLRVYAYLAVLGNRKKRRLFFAGFPHSPLFNLRF